MFAKVEKLASGKITHAYYVFDKSANPDLFSGVIVNDGIVDNLIRSNPAHVMDNYYYDNDTGFVNPRPANPATIDTLTIAIGAYATISGIPVNCVVTVDGVAHTVTDGVLQITSSSPGILKIDLELFPYLPATFEVTVG